MKPSSKSIGGRLGETFAKMSQVYRQRVTHLMSDGGEVPRMRESSGGSVKLSPSSNCCGGCATTLDPNYRENEVCSRNPVTKQQFLSLLKDVKRLRKIAEVPDKLPYTINNNCGSGKIENKGNVCQSDHVFVISCYRCFPSGFEAELNT